MKKSQRKFAYDDANVQDDEFVIHDETENYGDHVEEQAEEEEEETELEEEDEEEGEWDGEEDLLSGETDTSDDPVRTYLVQMGQIPLLNRQQEVAAAQKIELARNRYRYWMLSTDFMLQGATKLLEQVRDGKLRLDRTIEVSVTNAVEKKATMRRIGPNIQTLRHLLLRNHGDFYVAINKSLDNNTRRDAWKRLVRRRNKAVRLIEEMNLRTIVCNRCLKNWKPLQLACNFSRAESKWPKILASSTDSPSKSSVKNFVI